MLGTKVRSLLQQYAEAVDFYAPEIAFDDAAEHLPSVITKRAARNATPVDNLAQLFEMTDATLALIRENVRILPESILARFVACTAARRSRSVRSHGRRACRGTRSASG